MLAVFPTMVMLPLNLVSFWWGFKQGSTAMPLDVREPEREVGRYLAFLANPILVALVAYLLVRAGIPLAVSGLHTESWPRYALVGAVFAILWIALHRGFLVLVGRVQRERTIVQELVEGSVGFWLLQILIVDFAEEFWRAGSLSMLAVGKVSSMWSVGLTAAAFGAGHLGRGAFKAVGAGTFGVAAALLFLWSRSLVAPYVFHVVVTLYALFWSRWAVGQSGHGGR